MVGLGMDFSQRFSIRFTTGKLKQVLLKFGFSQCPLILFWVCLTLLLTLEEVYCAIKFSSEDRTNPTSGIYLGC